MSTGHDQVLDRTAGAVRAAGATPPGAAAVIEAASVALLCNRRIGDTVATDVTAIVLTV